MNMHPVRVPLSRRFVILMGLATALVLAAPGAARVVGRVHAYGPATQATVKIEVTAGPVIYIDPVRQTASPADADYILLTHNHGDHQSIADINRVRKSNTVFVTSAPGAPALMTNFPGATVHVVSPGDRLNLGGVDVDMVPMYNVVRNNHPRAMNFVGYVVNVGGIRVYHAGDTERFPEMRNFSVDVAMLPLGQTFTMTSVQEAADAALDLRARVAIPIHWGVAEGNLADANQFAALLAGRMQVVIDASAGFPLEVSETIAIAAQPASQTVPAGAATTLAVQASGSGALRYQWRRNGLVLPGATNNSVSIPSAAAANAGDYEVIVTDANGPVVSRMARLTVDTPRPGRIINLSVRASTRGPSLPLIVGCVSTGGSKAVLIRASGPALAAFGVAGTVIDPRLDIHAEVNGRDAIVASNDNWGGTPGLRALFAATGAFEFADPAGRDAALITAIDGARTIHASDSIERSGVTLIEVYDADIAGPSRLVNVSARNFAGTGDNTLIAGFVISGNVPKRLLIRGVGPRLQGFGVGGALLDPKVELFLTESGRSTLFASNDNWAESGVAPVRAAFISAGAFDLPDAQSRDAAVVVTAPAGAFTAQVSGVANTTGEALIEIYELP